MFEIAKWKNLIEVCKVILMQMFVKTIDKEKRF